MEYNCRENTNLGLILDYHCSNFGYHLLYSIHFNLQVPTTESYVRQGTQSRSIKNRLTVETSTEVQVRIYNNQEKN